MNAAWQQKKLLEFCKEKGIHVSAWSPLGANGASWGSLAVMESPILEEIAAAKVKSVAQVNISSHFFPFAEASFVLFTNH